MTTEFLTYRKFYEKEEADALAEVFRSKGIEFRIQEERENTGLIRGDNTLGGQFVVKIKGMDFEIADDVLNEESEKHILEVNEDHYLFGFTDEELMDILAKPDEWSEPDYQLSKKILKDRGKPLSEERIQSLKQERISELARPEQGNQLWTLIGYISSFLGGLLGIFIGWHLLTFRKTLPNGQRVYAYEWTTRKHGERILVIGSVVFIVCLIARVLTLDLD